MSQGNTVVTLSVKVTKDEELSTSPVCRKSPTHRKPKKSTSSSKPNSGNQLDKSRQSSLFPPIEGASGGVALSNPLAARRISNAFAQALSKQGQRPSDAMFLGAYASMFGNKLRNRKHSLAPSQGSSSQTQMPPVVVELPSYRLEPLPKQVVKWGRLQIMLDSMLTDFINRGKYNKTTAPQAVKNISQNIRTLSKELGFSKRYRVVATVEIGENMGQGFKSVSRCLWNTAVDGSATSFKSSPSVFIVASLYMVYMD